MCASISRPLHQKHRWQKSRRTKRVQAIRGSDLAPFKGSCRLNQSSWWRLISVVPKRHVFFGLSLWLVLVAHASAQESAVQYIEYPQILGKEQPLQLSGVPKWATFDGQVRARMENQTSDNYISGNDQAYVLTRIYGGMRVHPSEYLTGFIQFIDTHALGLPLQYTAANMRDTFDARQAYLDFHIKQYTI